MIRADEETLRCVLWNLFENAVKYSPDRDAVWVDVSTSGEHVDIAVRDRGIGIPASEQRRIFEKFSGARQRARAALEEPAQVWPWRGRSCALTAVTSS
jgi:signal transduction histidine kinase